MGRKKSTGGGGVRTVIAISDTHFGCQFGLCHPDGVALDGGGIYRPNRAQLQVARWWDEFWLWAKQHIGNNSFSVVHNGDAVDGVHHGSTHQWSHNHTDQHRAAVKMLLPIAEMARASGGNYFHIRGTEAHVGQSGENEEQLARELGAVPNQDGQHARWELYMGLGQYLIHFSHHIGTSGSAAYETSAVARELMAAHEIAARWNERPPNVIVRSHRHTRCKVAFPSAHGDIIGEVTPAWQLRTPFAYKIAGARQALPQIGGLLIHASDEIVYTFPWVRSLARSKEEQA